MLGKRQFLRACQLLFQSFRFDQVFLDFQELSKQKLVGMIDLSLPFSLLEAESD